jgi:hypothetical protein
MRLSEIDFNPSQKTVRQFAGLCLIFALAIVVDQAYVHKSTTFGRVASGILAVLGVVGLLAPKVIRPIYVGWMIAAFPIGWVISHLILGLIFFGLFTPLAFFFRLIGRDTLQRAPRRDAVTYYVPKTTPTDLASYLRQY